tara:strand:+ start:3296 stop:4252 length:957 start_codon:yes stop_codon:yes gene_type:complete
MDQINDHIYQALWKDYDSTSDFPDQTPLLAHYTSINNFDSIVEHDELWFSHPLNMNDSDELIFGMNQGAAEFKKNMALISACGNQEVFARLLGFFDNHFNHFDENHVLDTYILCFSQHEEKDFDGALSMWRGYGADGNGIVFVIDTRRIEPNENSPILLSPVDYATAEDRIGWIKQKVEHVAEILRPLEKSDEVLNAVAWYWIERLKVFSLFTKHKGFQDEKEWRFVYLRDRDSEATYPPMFGYHISGNGVEPKLKLRLDRIPRTKSEHSLESLINRIVLGPMASSELSKRSLVRLLELKGKPELGKKVYASSIPYRP